MARKIQALLFDMDGLLLDTEGMYIQVYSDLSRRLGRPQPPEVFKAFIGYSTYVTCDRVRELVQFSGTVEELVAKEEEIYFEFLERTRPKPFPGALELFELTEKRGLKRGLVSSTLARKVDPTMQVVTDHLGRRGNWRTHFHTVCTGDCVKNLKPAPDLYQLAARNLKLDPEECAAFEDSPAGVAAAHAAGCRVVAVPNIHLAGVDVANGKADHVFASLLEAYCHIEKVLNA
jgi:beta-phosphoglucomutase-like phosphatase (HAD superfamily)